VLRTALIVPVPEAGRIVDGWRERTCADKPSTSVPAHVTLLFPFVPAGQVDARLLGELATLFSAFSPFELSFARTARFPLTLYLEPEPAAPFVALTEAIAARYPEHPPYEGQFDTVVPHLTVAHGDPKVLDAAAAEVEPRLPISTTVREAVLLEEVEPDWGRWVTRRRFELRR
jgi:2'-5' RNA ligase